MDYIPPCIKGESNPRRVDGNDPGYHYPINADEHQTFIAYTTYFYAVCRDLEARFFGRLGTSDLQFTTSYPPFMRSGSINEEFCENFDINISSLWLMPCVPGLLQMFHDALWPTVAKSR